MLCGCRQASPRAGRGRGRGQGRCAPPPNRGGEGKVAAWGGGDAGSSPASVGERCLECRGGQSHCHPLSLSPDECQAHSTSPNYAVLQPATVSSGLKKKKRKTTTNPNQPSCIQFFRLKGRGGGRSQTELVSGTSEVTRTHSGMTQ